MGIFRDMMGSSGLTAKPMQNMATMTQGLQASATVQAIRDTGTLINNSPVVELDLLVTVPGQEPYPVKHRQLISPVVMANFQPGATFGVRVDQSDPSKLIIG
jgi:hypothetical protein